MTIAELLKKIKTTTGHPFAWYLSRNGYNLKLWDSNTREAVNISVSNILGSDEIDAVERRIITKYGGLVLLPEIAEEMQPASVTQCEELAAAIVETYKSNWYRLATDLNIYYNPVWNVDGKTTITESWNDYEHNTTRTTEQTRDAESTTEQIAAAETTTEQIDAGETTTEQITDAHAINKLYGYDNPTTATPNGEQTSNSGKSKVTSDAGTVKTTSDGGTVKTTSDAGKTETGENETISGEHSTVETRGGNQGVTMTSQMIRDDLDVYGQYNYIKAIAGDVVDFMSAGYWDIKY